MSEVDKRVVVAVVVVVLSFLQLILAGVALLASRSSEQELTSEQLRLQSLSQRVDDGAEATELEQPADNEPHWTLLEGPDVVTTLQVLQEIGDAVGIVFDSQKAVRASDVGKQPFVVAGRGTPDQVCAFVVAIEEHDRLMIIESGRLVPTDAPLVAFEFGLATYHSGGSR